VQAAAQPERAQARAGRLRRRREGRRRRGDIIAAGIMPAGLEMMDNPAIRAAEDFVHAGYPTDAAAILMCELDGFNAEVSEQIFAVRELLLAAGATETCAPPRRGRAAALLAGPQGGLPRRRALSPDYYCMDGTIPRAPCPRSCAASPSCPSEYGLPVANVFHAGDGNLHPLILYDANIPGELERAEELGGRILEHCVEVGGTITGEHGVGIEKLNQMCVQFSREELLQFEDIKAAFDPHCC
jgi:glycolate oxidase